MVAACRMAVVVHHGDVSQVATVLQIDTTTIITAGVVAYQDIVHICKTGIDTTTVAGGAVACDNGIGDAC